MSLNFAALLLALVGASLILTALSVRMLRGTAAAGESYSGFARFFLICLRLAIGWHCFIEGMEKLSVPNWSSEPFLRESMGPLAPFFRGLAGDRLIERVTVGPDDKFPAQLDREWRAYANAYATHYDLSNEQIDRLNGIVDQREKDTLSFLLSKTEAVTKGAPYPPEIKTDMTMKQRLEEYARLEKRVLKGEALFPSSDKDVHAEWKKAKADLAKWRASLKATTDTETALLKKALADVLTSEQKQMPPLPEPIAAPFASWQMLEWSDAAVKWSLIVFGGGLLLGLFSRTSSLALALLILSFYLAMPPLPGWPESPRLEGHYLLINKTLIEVIALLALTFIPTGRWAGLDALLQFVLPGCCGNPRAPAAPSAKA